MNDLSCTTIDIAGQVEKTKALKKELSLKVFKDNKTGSECFVLGVGINATNDRDCEIMVIYIKKEGNSHGDIHLCCEYREFLEEFTEVV